MSRLSKNENAKEPLLVSVSETAATTASEDCGQVVLGAGAGAGAGAGSVVQEHQQPYISRQEQDNNNNTTTMFQDDSTECAICFESLDETITKLRVVTLTTCGHKWHWKCLQQQIEQTNPCNNNNPNVGGGQRLVLTGCRCAKCGTVCDHPELSQLATFRTNKILLQKIDAILMDYCRRSDHNNNNNTETTQNQKQQLELELQDARRKYAIYLCSHCKEPYFGGTIDCADTVEGEVPPEERLCIACAPERFVAGQCHRPLQHRTAAAAAAAGGGGGGHVWKCRYCCQVATHVCYGTVHFCQACHDRNSERVELIKQQKQKQQQQQQSRCGITNNNRPPSCLTAIPCKGGNDCPFPKPSADQKYHKNGSTADCEQFYGCVWCASLSPSSHPNSDQEQAFYDTPPGSRNFLQNASGEKGHPQQPIICWQHHLPHSSSWQVEQSDIPLSNAITTNFVSNFRWCVMTQVVPLYRYLRPRQPPPPLTSPPIRVEVSAKYMGRTDCPSVFRMEALVLDENNRILQRKDTGQRSAPADFWEQVSLVLEIPQQQQQQQQQQQCSVAIVVRGKDCNFWAGNFGSKVTDCKVRILGEPDELEQLLLPEGLDETYFVPPRERRRRRTGGVFATAFDHHEQHQQQRQQHHHQRQRQRRRQVTTTVGGGDGVGLALRWQTMVYEGLFPVLCLIVLAWLLQTE